MTTTTTDPLVEVQRELDEAMARAAEIRERRDRMVASAVAAGRGVREIGRTIGVSGVLVSRLARGVPNHPRPPRELPEQG